MSAQLPAERRDQATGRSIETTLWLLAGVATLIADGLAAMGAHATWFLSLLAMLHGLRVFIAHGAGRATTLGLFAFAGSLFVGYAGMVASTTPYPVVSLGYVTTAVSIGYFTQVVVSFIAWGSNSQSGNPVPMANVRDAQWLTLTGWLTLAVLLVGYSAGPPDSLSLYMDGGAFASVVLIFVGLLFREDTRPFSARMILLAATFLGYAHYFSQGTGRLRLVAMACALLMLVTHRFPLRIWKWLTVIVTPVGVYWLAQDRLNLQASLNGGTPSGHTGLESMTSAIVVFAQVIEHAMNGGALAYGRTFLTLPFVILPKGLFPWAPVPLGYELVKITDPGRYGSGFSVASTVYGEWVYNFSIIGSFLAIPVLMVSLRWLDGRFHTSLGHIAEGRRALLWLVFWAMLCGSIADLAWSGVHTIGARTLSRVPILLLLAFLARPSAPQPRPPLPVNERSPGQTKQPHDDQVNAS